MDFRHDNSAIIRTDNVRNTSKLKKKFDHESRKNQENMVVESYIIDFFMSPIVFCY